MATPSIAGLATLVHQYFKEGWYSSGKPNQEDSINASSSLIRAILVHSALPIRKGLKFPSGDFGFGIPHLSNTLYFSNQINRLHVINHRQIFNNTIVSFCLNLLSNNYPLVITLAWIDPPLDPESPITIFADLDLILFYPDQQVSLGNGFEFIAGTTKKNFFI